MAEEQTITNCTFRLDKSDESNRLSSMGEESEKEKRKIKVNKNEHAFILELDR